MQLIRYTVADSEFSFNLEAAYERQDSGWEKRKIEGEGARAREFTCILLCAIPSFYTFSLFSCFLLLLLMFFRLVLLVCFWDIYFFRASIHDDFHLVCIISMIVQRLSVHKNAIESGPYTHSTYTFHKLNALTCLITKKTIFGCYSFAPLLFPFSFCRSFFRFGSLKPLFLACFPNSFEFRITFCCYFYLIKFYFSVCHYIFHHMIMMRFIHMW